MIAAPRLLAGLMPVPVMGMVAKCTKNTANPIGSGTKSCRETKSPCLPTYVQKKNHRPNYFIQHFFIENKGHQPFFLALFDE